MKKLEKTMREILTQEQINALANAFEAIQKAAEIFVEWVRDNIKPLSDAVFGKGLIHFDFEEAKYSIRFCMGKVIKPYIKSKMRRINRALFRPCKKKKFAEE